MFVYVLVHMIVVISCVIVRVCVYWLVCLQVYISACAESKNEKFNTNYMRLHGTSKHQ